MKIALAQIDILSGQTDRNIKKICHYIDRAKCELGADLIIFPEMSDTGYDLPEVSRYASDWKQQALPDIAVAAKRNQINVIAGLSERVGEDIYNSSAFIDRGGRLKGAYRKTHLATVAPLHEEKYILPGNELLMVTFDNIRIGILTCYELRFPELSRALALAGTQLLIVNSAFPLIRARHCEVLVEARAIENQMFVAAANRVGSAHDGRLHFAGNSKIVDAMGSIMCSALHTDETLLSANIDIDQLAVVRENIKVFHARRESICNSTVVIDPFS